MAKSRTPENGKPVVLVAEDERGMLGALVEVLSRHGFTALSARTGDEAVAIALQARPDVILMDVMMPLLDGYAAARILKRDPRTENIPIIAFHAPPVSGGGRRGRCIKGYDEKHLLERIHGALEKHSVGDGIGA
ncbi:MAG: response regulator [Candidatus Eisenbacteria bacterium]